MPPIRTIDAVWLIFLGALAAVGLLRESHSPYEWFVLLALGAVQMAETRLAVSTDRTAAALTVAVKLALCYWFVAETGGIESSYYLIFFLPIVSAASLFELSGVFITTAASVGLYLSFLLFVDFKTNYLTPEGIRELALRVPFFFLIAIVVNRLATENRRKTEHSSRGEPRTDRSAGRGPPVRAIGGARSAFGRARARNPQPSRSHFRLGGSP